MSEIEKVKAGLLAIENDDREKLKSCVNCLFPSNHSPFGNATYYYKSPLLGLFPWDSYKETHLPTIKASELWDIIQNQKLDNEL